MNAGRKQLEANSATGVCIQLLNNRLAHSYPSKSQREAVSGLRVCAFGTVRPPAGTGLGTAGWV
jgi:hypothetical protein